MAAIFTQTGNIAIHLAHWLISFLTSTSLFYFQIMTYMYNVNISFVKKLKYWLLSPLLARENNSILPPKEPVIVGSCFPKTAIY